MENESSIQLSPEDRARLEGWVADRNTPQKLVWRARIVLMWAQGAGVTAIVRATGKTKRTAYRWRDRYLARGVEGLERDASRPGRKPPLTAPMIERVVDMTLQREAAGGHALVGAQARQGGRPQPLERAAHLGGARAQAASDAQLQAVQRSASFVRRFRTSSGSISTRPTRRWCFRSTRRARSRRSTAPSRACRSRRAAPAR